VSNEGKLMSDYPKVVFTHPASGNPGDESCSAFKTCIVFEGHDISSVVTGYRIVGEVADAIKLELTFLVSSVEFKAPAKLALGRQPLALVAEHDEVTEVLAARDTEENRSSTRKEEN
jgi:hypothetical protein